MSNALKIILLAISAIIVCVVAVVGIKITNEGKTMTNAGTTQIKAATGEYQDVSLSIYNNECVLGSSLTNFISESIDNEDYVAISVKTLASATADNYNYTPVKKTDGYTITAIGSESSPAAKPTTTISAVNYINPSAQFLGSVYKDVNNNIVYVAFIQQD
jgi:hypothetical protein